MIFMDANAWIALGVLVVAIVAAYVSHRQNQGQINRHKEVVKKQISDEHVKFQQQVNDNYTRIVRIETDILAMKKEYKYDIVQLKGEFEKRLDELFKQNREDHQIMFKQLGGMAREITEAATLIKSHAKDEK